MITYEPFRRMTKERNISTYKLINYYAVGRSLLHRLKHDLPITTVTLNDLCLHLNCRVEDIVEFHRDESENVYLPSSVNYTEVAEDDPEEQ
ncbi:MAG: helix-turn-helix domain-containing protein [Lachnospiraceae bacterium]|jgi:DNA-binding Xre family transcriptional regulator|nr:helix-turn-helix domain-containing protein [Lachnospiraceae bacterium]